MYKGRFLNSPQKIFYKQLLEYYKWQNEQEQVTQKNEFRYKKGGTGYGFTKRHDGGHKYTMEDLQSNL